MPAINVVVRVLLPNRVKSLARGEVLYSQCLRQTTLFSGAASSLAGGSDPHGLRSQRFRHEHSTDFAMNEINAMDENAV